MPIFKKKLSNNGIRIKTFNDQRPFNQFPFHNDGRFTQKPFLVAESRGHFQQKNYVIMAFTVRGQNKGPFLSGLFRQWSLI